MEFWTDLLADHGPDYAAKVGFILKFHCTLDSIFTASLIPILLYYWFHFHCTHVANFTVLVDSGYTGKDANSLAGAVGIKAEATLAQRAKVAEAKPSERSFSGVKRAWPIKSADCRDAQEMKIYT